MVIYAFPMILIYCNVGASQSSVILRLIAIFTTLYNDCGTSINALTHV